MRARARARYLTWDAAAFPAPAALQEDLASRGRRMVTIVDPHIKRDPGYYIYAEAARQDFFVKDRDGNEFDGRAPRLCGGPGPREPGATATLTLARPRAQVVLAGRVRVPGHAQPGRARLVGAAVPAGRVPGLHAAPVRLERHERAQRVQRPRGAPAARPAPRQACALRPVLTAAAVLTAVGGAQITMHKDSLHHGAVEHRCLHNLYGTLYHNATAQARPRRRCPAAGPRTHCLAPRSGAPA